jgi:hypothetical protein
VEELLSTESESCRRICLETVAHCLEVGGSHVEGEHIQCLLDCAEFCQILANFSARGSDAIDSLCASGADLCERCARECEAFGDAQMAKCAAACRSSADTFRQHVSMLAA